MEKNSPILQLKNVVKSFGNQLIHQGVNLKLFRGQNLGLLGPSGSGKSVLLRSIIGLEFIDEGNIFYNKKRIDHLDEDQYTPIRIKISYSFQNGALFDSDNVFENLAFPLYEHANLPYKEIESKVDKMLQLIGLPDKGLMMPSDLSGGMQKRVGMARAMILEPDIILYDEPTAGLDPANTKNILDVMLALKEKKITSIFVTHDIPAALKVCDTIAILHEGKIAFQGTPNEVLESENPIVRSFLVNEINKM